MTIAAVPLKDVWELRREVMYPELSIDGVKLPDDESGNHLGLYDGDDLVSVVSVFVTNNELQFRKFATRAAMQNKGYGTTLLKYVMDVADQMQCIKVWCNARTSATKFYEKFGMKATGDTWLAKGHELIKMEKQL
ncbi:GNAT family N-acetyltransferase [Danxiaibacter flavus]|uniref:GNAT family N-acetyltransferase n=1 Tax=Danxiaibacter flavus TaxID=3049108 RepID=A0ABV3ZCN2_9BACT|nr:GNAT family N-acetyltransferase [Chitinophagaceae bacterium DXS]